MVVQMQTMLNVICNSGAKTIRCITVVGKKAGAGASVGDTVVGSVQSIRQKSASKVKRTQVVRAVIALNHIPVRRPDGTQISFRQWGCVLVNHQGKPLGTRIKCVLPREIRKHNAAKIFSMGLGLV
ncbi:unnamed protein product [Chrysoparadoxa australica]